MDYYFVSDDSYFLQGIENSKFFSKWNAKFIHAGDMPERFRPNYSDFVVINVSDVILRNRILREPFLTGTRVIVLLACNLVTKGWSRSHFPWVMPSNISENKLLYVLSRAERASLTLTNISQIGRWMFWCLGQGYSLNEISENTGFSVKYLHGLKLRIMKRCGLTGGHARGVLYCRDLAAMYQQHLPGNKSKLKWLNQN